MPLVVLLPVVVLGIVGIGVILHLGGHTARRTIESDAAARAALARLKPEVLGAEIDLAGGAALVLAPEGPMVLRGFGANTVLHRIAGLAPQARGLRIDFADFAAPPVTLALSPVARDRWLTLWNTRHAAVS